MRISDWSSDVCSSDLASTENSAPNSFDTAALLGCVRGYDPIITVIRTADGRPFCSSGAETADPFQKRYGSVGGETAHSGRMRTRSGRSFWSGSVEIGRAWCRERVCQYV